MWLFFRFCLRYILRGWFCFFFKQKTAYEMRISDWSSDVCSSDLLDAYVETRPGAALLTILHALAPSAKGVQPTIEELADQDWLTLSQQGLEPVRAGRFFVHTSHHADAVPAGTTPFLIDASQAFGTGGHDTTAGCLTMRDRLARQGQSGKAACRGRMGLDGCISGAGGAV